MEAEGSLRILDLLGQGPLSYARGLALQEDLHRQRVAGAIPDTIIFLEHSPVVSLGRRGSGDDILVDPVVLQEQDIEVHLSDRGGQVTFHGPGQLVVYAIVDMHHRLRHIRALVEGLEQAFVKYLDQQYGLRAWIENQYPGIWIEAGKVAALGISVRDRVTMHGVALNLSTDMNYFRYIVPCGIRHRPPASVASAGLTPQSLVDAALALTPLLAESLGYSRTWRETLEG